MKEDIKKLIEENPVALATVCSDGNPNVIPIAFAKVVSDNEIVITDNFMIQTRENLQSNKNVCLSVWNKDWNGYKILGEAQYIKSGKWKNFIEEMKENEGLSAKGAILIVINKLIKLK